jgi:hypothetical protein
MRCLAGVVVALATLTGACSGSGTTSPTSNQTMTALIDGATWTAVTVTALRSSDLISITGSDASTPTRTIALSLVGSSIGTYTTSTGSSNAVLSISPSQWTANVLGGSGTITLTDLTTTGATGTFSFTAVPGNAATTGTEAVTSGAFTVTF